MMQSVATVLIVLCGLVGSSHAKQNQCSGGKVSCPNDSTCCALSNRSFSCCPIQNAVCCGDSVNCCPDGYTCDVIKGICNMGGKLVPPSKKIPAKPVMKVLPTKKRALVSASDGTRCPDKKYQCPKENTCCKLPSGMAPYGCCPLENAVCCSDHKHCCPEGYTCDLEAGKCKHIELMENIPATKTSNSIAGEYIKGFETKAFLQKISALKTTISTTIQPPYNRICPDGESECGDTQTCCKTNHGYRCCRFYRAICCRGGLSCCPAGYICDDVHGTCVGRRSNGRACPDKKYQCPEEGFCSKLPSGTYGCCPLENAVWCSDEKHCCPEGYTCDAVLGKCSKTAEQINMIENVPAIKTSKNAELKYIHCPDGCSCFENETCCELADGHFGCCPSSEGVCCSDHEHCCPAGFSCDLTAQMCVTGNVRLPMLKKSISSRRPKTQQPNLDQKIHFVPAQTHGGDPVTDDDKLGRKSLKNDDNQT